jgi:uncharacterized protein YodC (DUF2158 family)
MATAFKKGDVVEVKSVAPKGPVQALRMDEDGNVFYLVEWKDIKGVTQQRWFEETTLTASGE